MEAMYLFLWESDRSLQSLFVKFSWTHKKTLPLPYFFRLKEVNSNPDRVSSFLEKNSTKFISGVDNVK